jgi:uncharacterized membrane protein (DUF4010 family)
LLLAVVVLPLLPSAPVDPWGIWEPRRIGLLMALMSSVGFVGYVLTKFIDPGRSILLTAAAGGLASSTAVTLGYSAASRKSPAVAALHGLGVAVACIVMLPRALALIAVANAVLARGIAPILVAAAVTGTVAVLVQRRRPHNHLPAGKIEFANPFGVIEVLKYGLLFTAIIAIARVAHQVAGMGGIALTALVSGLTDVDAIALSLADQARAGHIGTGDAQLGILLAMMSNSAVKIGIVLLAADRGAWRSAIWPVGLEFAVLAVGAAASLG